MKRCPRCGEIVSYNSYFGAYICDNCNWEDCSRINELKTKNIDYNKMNMICKSTSFSPKDKMRELKV